MFCKLYFLRFGPLIYIFVYIKLDGILDRNVGKNMIIPVRLLSKEVI